MFLILSTFTCSSFNNTTNNADNTVWTEWMTVMWVGKDVKGTCSCWMQGSIPTLAWRDSKSLSQDSLYLSWNLNVLLHKCKSAVLLELPHSVIILNVHLMAYMICTWQSTGTCIQEMLSIDIVPSNQFFRSEHIGYSSVIF